MAGRQSLRSIPITAFHSIERGVDMRYRLTIQVEPVGDEFNIRCPAFPDILIPCKTIEEGMEQVPDAIVHAMDRLFMKGVTPPFGEHFGFEADPDGTPPNILPYDSEALN